MSNNQVVQLNRGRFLLQASLSGSGPALVVIGSHQYYPRIFSDALSSACQVICMDTRAFAPENGLQEPSDFTLDRIMEDIEAFLEKLNLKKVILVGHSIHAFMALEFAKRYPEAVSHLVLIASSPEAGLDQYAKADRYFEESVCPERKAALNQTMQKYMAASDPSFVDRMMAFGPRLWYRHDFDASLLWKGVEVNPMGANIIWGPLFVGYNTKVALQQVKCPLFLGLGRYDYFNPPELWDPYRSFSSNLTVRIFERSGHTPPYEEPENFNRSLLEWLRF